MAEMPQGGSTETHSVTNVAAHTETDVVAQTVTETREVRGPRGVAESGEPWIDVEMEVRLHFGGREMLLSEALEIGPGTVLELDRHVSDPVDLLVGDRIVARGEVVVLGGNFALQISEVLPPQPRLESVRCLL